MQALSENNHMALTSAQRKALKARAHHLRPVVRVGQKGIFENLLAEIELALATHELIKVHIARDDKSDRQNIAEALARHCQADVVNHIGKIAILYRVGEKKT